MSGGITLGDQIRRANVKTKFTAANIITTPEMGLDGILQPYVDFERGGIKIRVIGLTTSDNYFEYSIRPGKIQYSVPVGEAQAKKAKEDKRELVIALTHLGTIEDKSLAAGSTSIDVIIGGHSHTNLENAIWITNKNGKKVPIVQAWAHGLSVGTLLLDVSDKGEVKVVEYKLHDVGAPLEADPEMVAFVAESAKKRNAMFDFNFDEVIGQSKVSLTGSTKGYPTWSRTCWGNHLARAMRKAAGAQVGLNVSGFAGVYKQAGPVTYGDIIDNQPHIHKTGDQGWEIATVYMSGWKLKPLMNWLTSHGYPVDFSGLGYLTVDQLEDKGTYRIAFPAEIAEAVNGSLTQYRQYLLGLKYTKKFLWPVMMDYVKENSPISCDKIDTTGPVYE
jgi:2',3'-cyclic-nucleotide 2'-phosphodiesterase (5'-nucleotidase family)